jgi:succinate dehydrogenase / fumarate reductase cytochrome b subunit
MARRPLSPHLTIYRFGYTMSLSILHRFTGLGLSIGLLLLASTLVALASGPEGWQRFVGAVPGPVFRIVGALVLLAFVYHLANGVRHLFWDAGKGFERHEARRSGRFVVIFAIVAGGAALWALMRLGGGAP